MADDPKNEPSQWGSAFPQFKGQGAVRRPDTEIRVGGTRRTLTGELPDYAWGYQSGPDSLDDLDNYDKLSRWERDVSEALPKFASGPVGKALSVVNESWLGKNLLPILDVLAEGLERGVGFASQLTSTWPGEEADWNEIKAAWHAGTVAYETLNLPKFRDGRFVVPHDLPGLDAVVTVRQNILRYTGQGMGLGEATAKAKEDYYNSLGALAIRAQLQDTLFHVVADPLNFLAPLIKPIELAGLRKIGLLRVPSVAQNAELIAELTTKLDAAKAADNVADVARLEGALETARGVASRAAEMRALDEAALARAFPKGVPEATDIAAKTKIADAVKAARTPEEAARFAELSAAEASIARGAEQAETVSELELKLTQARSRASTSATEIEQFENSIDILNRADTLTPGQEKFMKFMGVIPTDGRSALSKLWRSKFNPFGLTPASRAYELGNTVVDRILSDVVGHMDDPEEALAVLQRIAKGLTTPELGASVATTEGRAVRAAVQSALAKLEGNTAAWRATMFERGLFEELGRALGKDPAELLQQALNGESGAILAAGSKALAAGGPDVQRGLLEVLAQRGATVEQLTPDFLAAQAHVLKDTPLISLDAFRAASVDAIVEATAHAAVLHFGVKARGFLQHMSQTMKSAENLAFLRINPGFAVRNYLSNEFTSIARGSGGLVSKDDMLTFWNRMGVVSPKLSVGYTAAEIATQGTKQELAHIPGASSLKVADDIIADAAAGKTGWLRRIEASLRKVNLGKFDMGAASSRIEQGASERIGTIGAMRGMKYYRRVPKLPPEVVAEIGPEAAKAIQRSAGGALNRKELEALVTDIGQVTAGRISADADDALRANLGNILGEEEVAVAAERLAKAAREGGVEAVRREAENVRGIMRQRIASILEEENGAIASHVAARVETEGPLGIATTWGDRMDNLAGAQPRWDMDAALMAARARAAREGAGPGVAGAAWQELHRQGDAFWKNEFDRVDRTIDGVLTGLKKVEDQIGPQPALRTAMTDAKRLRTGWKSFFEWRNNKLNEFFASEAKTGYDELMAEISQRYEAVAAQEDTLMTAVDRALEPMIPEGARPMWRAWRSRSAELRRMDREAVVSFRTNPMGDGRPLHQLSEREIVDLYQSHRQARMTRVDAMQNNERAGVAAMAGNPRAQAQFAERAAAEEAAIAARKTRLESVSRRANDVVLSAESEEGARLARAGTAAGVPGDIKLMSLGDSSIRYAQSDDSVSLLWIGSKNSGDGEVLFERFLREVETAGKTEFATTFQTAGAKGGEGFFKRMVERGYIRLKDKIDLGVGKGKQEYLYEIVAKGSDSRAAIRQALIAEPPTKPFVGLPRLGEVSKDPMFMGEGLDHHLYERGDQAIDALRDAAIRARRAPPIKGVTSPAAQAAMRKWLVDAQGELSSTKYKALRFSEYLRDASLLDYNRRYNYNTWLGTIMPYEFWMTTSMRKWALHSIDRPAMLSTYLRMEKMLRTATPGRENTPARLQGKVRIPMPFLPKWMGGGLFVDPLASALPFRQWDMPFQLAQRRQFSDQGAAEKVLEELLNDGSIEQAAYDAAIKNRTGPDWDRAMALARQDQDEDRPDNFDIASMLSSPHAPLMWAYNVARGRPQEIGPFVPLTRTIKGVSALLGLGPPGGINVEGAVRQQLGLHPFDKWDDYRIDRMLSNMAGTGEISVTEARMAMMERQGEIFDRAKTRAGREFGIGVLGSTLGVSAGIYPEGEQNLRSLQEGYQEAWKRYEAGDLGAVREFNNEHPEYEARLALFKKPEERLRDFLVDELWSKWNELPKLHQDELRDQLGPLFQNAFLNRDTRSYDAISSDMLGVWLKYAGGEVPGNLALAKNVPPPKLSDSQIAQQLEGFYATRDQRFRYDTLWPLQQEYFKLDKGAERRAFRAANPVLEEYWDWRRDFMERNPDLAPYIEDDPAKRPTYTQAELQKLSGQPNFTPQEWLALMPPSAGRLVGDYVNLGIPLPEPTIKYLDDLAAQMGTTREAILQQMGQ